MRLIDAHEARRRFAFDWAKRRIDHVPTIDPIRAAGGCRCMECKISGHCSAEDTFRIARIADPFCCAGKVKEAQDDMPLPEPTEEDTP